MDQITKPLKFKPNRVKRLYRGGSGIDRLRGAAPVDSNYPEDWIASCVEGNTREFVAPGHGLSVCELDGQELPFPRLLREHAAAMLGPEHLERFGAAPGVLAKLLDSAVLLPLQVHPDSASARRHFHSEHGKTEAWIILATREINGEKPYLLLGFNERLDTERFRRESLDGEFHAALGMLHKFEVAPGDVFVVQGRMPHAIGPGITMVEVMEPTDYVIIPERNCFGKELTLEKRFAGLAPEDALDIFDFTPSSREEVVRRCRPEPELIERRASGTSRRLISRSRFKFFEAQELCFDGVWELDLSEKSFRIGVVVEGEALLKSGATALPLCAGDSFFIPYATTACRLVGQARIILVLPPTCQIQRNK